MHLLPKRLCLFLLLLAPFAASSMEHPIKKLNLTEEEWKKHLTPEQFYILRKHGTEPAHSSPLNKEYHKGTFLCAGCDLPLFRSETKYDSGTGWPSFYDYIRGHLAIRRDWSLLFPRTEYHCARCGGHQGHIFKDGPPPTGLRYCNNGVALKFAPDTMTLKTEKASTIMDHETAIFAGGCFWCMQHPFDQLKGVISTTVGYTGGHTNNPTYDQVSHGNTGHYESIKIAFDPSIISYKQILQNYWHNVDPFDDKGQFCDHGPSYQSVIFYENDIQKKLAEESKVVLEKEFNKKITTKILPASIFYPAEDYHQEFYKKNPIRYKFYRYRCSRDARLTEVWSNETSKQ